MMAEPSDDWNVFPQILVDHWEGCKHVSPRYDLRYDDGLVAEMLGGGHPDTMGSIE
jgi:hypothetical protein